MARILGLRLSFISAVLSMAITGISTSVSAQARDTSIVSSPTAFEENKGQMPAEYRFLSRRNGMETLYAKDGMEVLVPKSRSKMMRFRVRWTGANPDARILGEQPLSGRANYFRGADESRWVKDVPLFGRVRYMQIYQDVDVVFYENGDELENDFTVAAGGNPSSISLHLDRPVRLSPSGDLYVMLDGSVLSLHKPIAYQMSENSREEVPVKFSLAQDGRVGFEVEAYDHTRPLVIDPVFGFSTYLAGTGIDHITGVTTDSIGNVYVTGDTNSVDFPVANAEQPNCASCTDFSMDSDAYVSKLDPTGHTLVYSTYVGGSVADRGHSIVVDKTGNILVAGVSGSNDFPHHGTGTPPVCQINNFCYFVFSLTPNGSAFNYSGLVGGSEAFLSANSADGLLAVDSAGNAYLTGETDDLNFQFTSGVLSSTLNPAPTGTTFVLKVGTTGTLLYSTAIPGNGTPTPIGIGTINDFPAGGILVDTTGRVTLAGSAGVGLPTTAGVLQPTFPNDANAANARAGYILQLNATASALNFATYVTGTDTGTGLAVDSNGDYYIIGTTVEANLPVSANAFQKTLPAASNCECTAGYVAKLDSQGKSLLAATYVSGPTTGQQTNLSGIVLDSKSNVFLGGLTTSADFSLVNPIVSVLQPISSGGTVLVELTPDLSVQLFGSFLNSLTNFAGSQFTSVAIDPLDNVVVVGNTSATDFPTTQNSFQPVLPPAKSPLSSPPHGFISKLDLATPAPSLCLKATSVDFGFVLVKTSATQTLQVTNCGNAPLQLSSIVPSLPVFTISQSCGSIAPNASCGVNVNFLPVDTSQSNGTLVISENAPISQRTITITGAGGLPQVAFPPEFNADDLLVGTQHRFLLPFTNTGNANWIVSSVTATGDFSVDNACTSPVPPLSPGGEAGTCFVGLIFGPTTTGMRTGTLTIADNIPGSPHVIQLSGNGLATYPTPTITFIRPVPTDELGMELDITGTNFFPASQVIVNGSVRATHYGNETQLVAQLTASDLAQTGEVPVTVVNSLPGGGVSNTFLATVYDAIRSMGILHTAFDSNSGLLYSSVSMTSTTNAGKVVVIDPSTGNVVHIWSVGNGPNQLAVSGDGQFLYVGLDGDKKVAQVALATGVVNFSVGLGNDPDFNNPMVAQAIRVLPGLPHAWAVTLCATSFTPCGEGIAVFDDAIQRPTRVFENQVQPDGLLFIGADATTLFGTTFFQIPSTFYEFSINAAGITQTQAVTNFSAPSPGGGPLDSDGTSIYVSNGQVIDPATLTITGDINGINFQWGVKVDVPATRIYFAGIELSTSDFPFGKTAIQAFDLASQKLLSELDIPESAANAEIFRWGTNGLALSYTNTLLLLRTSITGTSAASSQLLVSGWAPASVPAGTADLALTISGSQFASGDTLTANGTTRPITVVNSSEITTTIPAALLAGAGNVQIVITNPAGKTATFVFAVTPGPPPIAAVSPGSLKFTAQLVSTTSASQAVTVQNNGTTTLIVSSVAITGDFAQTNSCTSVAPSMKCTVAVTFAPTAAGDRTGVLTINDNDVSNSQTVTLDGAATDVQITGSGASGTTATVASGQPATYNLSVTPVGGFNGIVTFSCTGLPQFAMCSANPPSTTLTAGAVSVVVTITTRQQQAAAIIRRPGTTSATISFLGMLLLLVCAGRKRSAYRYTLAKTLLVLIALLLIGMPLMSCGGGSGGGQPTSNTTPPGTYTVTFVATSAGGSRSIPLTLVVQQP
jgi:hypothetical protein